MKYTWEPGDIQCGRRLRSKNASEEWIIGYDPSKGRPHLALVSLADGQINKHGLSADEMAMELNERGMRPLNIMPDD